MQEAIDLIKKYKIIPVVKVRTVEEVLPIADALIAAGLPIIEVAFRSEAAAGAMALLARERKNILVGAGTVLTTDQVDAAQRAGASFMVCPGFNPRIVDYAHSRDCFFIPGMNSPSQVLLGLERGIRLFKFFPAEVSGGVAMLQALHGPFPEISFVASGGVGHANMHEYLALKYVVAVGGSWMVKEEMIAQGDFEKIRVLCAASVKKAQEAAA